MGVGAGLYAYVVVVQKFTFAISSPDEFLFQLPAMWSQPFPSPAEMSYAMCGKKPKIF